MSKANMNKRQSIISGLSVSTANETPMSFEQYLSMAQELTHTPIPKEESQTMNPSEKPGQISKKSKEVSSKYGIHVQRNKGKNNFIELNKQKLEKPRQDQVQSPQGVVVTTQGGGSWRNLIRGVLDLQRGKIPLLLAVEAGNQSMVRELLSSQTTEQLTVRIPTLSLSQWREKSIIYYFD